MAEVGIDAARAARAHSRRLCVDSRMLRLAVQPTLRVATARNERAETVVARAAARARRAAPVASPWSKLLWLRADDELSRVLVSVD
jgi:hypothetical protein